MSAAATTRPVVDVAVVGGQVADGTGRSLRRLDVMVRDGRVLDLVPSGEVRTADGTVVDATDRIVTPGFVDLHSHADFTLPSQRSAETALAQGVTTLVTGNCGFSPFPCDPRGDMARLSSAMSDRLSWAWDDQEGYADVLRRDGIGVNVAPLVGHTAVRLVGLGSDQLRPPTPAEQQRMEQLVDEAAAAGAFGLSTGLIYAPGSFADSTEVRGLVARVAAHDLLYATHMRNESGDLLGAVREALDVARATGARLQISHLKAMGPAHHGLVRHALGMVDDARAEGVDVACDVYPYTASSTMLASRLPSWALDSGPRGLLRRLRDDAERERVRSALTARFGDDVDPTGVVIIDDDPELASRSLTELGEAWGTDPAEAALRVLERREGVVGIINHAMAEADVEAVLRHGWSAVASDGWVMTAEGTDTPHPRSFGTFARVFQRYVRERQVLPLVEAVRKASLLPASRVRLADRGVLTPGAVADIVVLDPDTVTEHATFDQPRRLATGVDRVLLAGRVAFCDGRVQDRCGEVLRPG